MEYVAHKVKKFQFWAKIQTSPTTRAAHVASDGNKLFPVPVTTYTSYSYQSHYTHRENWLDEYF